MSRIDETFARLRAERQTGLVTYVTAGDPDLERSGKILRTLDRAGADILEVGVPFSDPLADGPVIQRASERALAAGGTLTSTLDLIAGTRPGLRAPVVIFSYANPILAMGIKQFASRAAAAGVDGVLVLDLPLEESLECGEQMTLTGLDMIFLLSPTTTDERIRAAGEMGRGFLYGISRLGVTGARDRVADGARSLAERIRRLTTLPIALGFGISKPEHVEQVGRWADAAVVGSGLVSVIADTRDVDELEERVTGYVQWLRPAPRTQG